MWCCIIYDCNGTTTINMRIKVDDNDNCRKDRGMVKTSSRQVIKVDDNDNCRKDSGMVKTSSGQVFASSDMILCGQACSRLFPSSHSCVLIIRNDCLCILHHKYKYYCCAMIIVRKWITMIITERIVQRGSSGMIDCASCTISTNVIVVQR